jgi:hypothetical protein
MLKSLVFYMLQMEMVVLDLRFQSNLHRRICYITLMSVSYISYDNMTGLTITEGTFQ